MKRQILSKKMKMILQSQMLPKNMNVTLPSFALSVKEAARRVLRSM